jgi:hypothetical protein
MADFMLGLPAVFSQGGSQIVAEKQNYVGAYVQDVWRMSSHLTVNYGLRWEPFFAAKDQNNFNMAFVRELFDQGVRSTVYPKAPVGLVFPGDPNFPDRATTNNPARWHRAGIIWDQGDNVQTIRAAVGQAMTRRSCGNTGITC